ncbi:hypothetical protein [Altibacter lentus]|uniref:hypothetical protein n=1 Tax=Altibacter lentus TaxID=1223410 RepID=UPI000558259B|nr:hypothetical protein [Altibacter lentus]
MTRTIGCGILLIMLQACGGSTTQGPKNIIGDPEPNTETETVIETPVISEPILPKGAVTANYITKKTPFYAYVKGVDKSLDITEIAFEDAAIPAIRIPETVGASLSSLRFNEFESDLLLVTAKIKDPNFNKYYLYQFRNGRWEMVVNRFAIHRSHVNDTLIPITVDPANPGYMLRYYSVFDLDAKSDLGYTWRLLRESVPYLKQ